METIVKRATLQELDVMTNLFEQYRLMNGGSPEMAVFQTEQELEQMLEGQRCIVFVAVKQLNGVLHYLGYAKLGLSASQRNGDWMLKELFVLPEAQENGVEERLLTAAASYANLKDVKALLAEASVQSEQMKPFFEGIG
ncbi:hypothetical protein DNH61_11145 [Paenibacillus sambharensis]|uniref:Uncharacterized protein n=1 Tax=Paenibacillus sambharensis TaxID=1803190 RepID=A0A2W1LB74_9BACL|nr:GNAT family N-acetyltransferase [Paenibacillus sambharensis]PZD95979.1 hypothetical protein DNH61_11145 [Paenibacillus sambharensis]